MKTTSEMTASVPSGALGIGSPEREVIDGQVALHANYTPLDIVRIIVISVSVYATMLSFPAVLGALARAFSLSDRQIGWLGSAELLGVTCGTLIIAHTRGQQAKRWLFIAAALVGGGNLMASQSANYALLVVSMWLVGIGAGLGGGFAYKAAGQSNHPARILALVHACQLSMGVVGYQALKVVLPAYGIQTALQGYAALALLVLLAASTLVIKGAETTEGSPQAWSWPPRSALLVLLAFWFFCSGEVGLYAFLERIGEAQGFPVVELSNALSGFALAGIAGSILMAALPTSWPPGPLLLLALLVGELAVAGMFNAGTIGQFTASCAAFGFFVVITIPTVLSVVSRIDPTGRSTALGLTVASTGQAIGPGVAGMFVINSNYTPVGWFAGACYLLAIVGVLFFLCKRST